MTLVVIEVAGGMRRRESSLTLRFAFGWKMDSQGQGEVQLHLRSLDEIILKRKEAKMDILMTLMAW